MSNDLYTHVSYHYFFSFYSLELDQNCQFDFLAVYDGLTTNTGLIGKVCGVSRPTFQSSSNGMTVVLSTDYANSYRGFSARYTSILPDPPEPDSKCICFSLPHMNLPFCKKYRDLTKVTADVSLHSGSYSLSTKKKNQHALVSLIEHPGQFSLSVLYACRPFFPLSELERAASKTLISISSPAILHWHFDSFSLL